MIDLLKFDYINSIPQPFMVTFCGGDEWPVQDIEVQTGLIRFDVCGLLQIRHISESLFFTDSTGVKHDPDTFYVDN